MENAAQLLEDSLLVIWNDRNAERRLQAMQNVYAEDIHFYESDHGPAIVGYQQINEVISNLQAQWPTEFQFEITRPATANHQVLSKTNKVSYLCRLFDASRTAYYRYRRGESHNADKKYNRPKHEVRIEFIRNMKRYGSRRIKESLKQKGIRIGRRKVVEIMRKEGLRAIQPPRFIPRTTDSKHGKRVCDNLLLNQPKPDHPDAVWVSDITYMPLETGKWAYLCIWMDLFSRQIVGWKIEEHMQENLVREPLEKALLRRGVKPGLINHRSGDPV